MRRIHAIWAASLLTALLVVGGCGDGDVAVVSGAVKVDGAPLKQGFITFVPADGKTATSGGAITDGRYSVKVPVGSMKVSVSASKVVGRKKLYDTPNSPEQDVTQESLPARYNGQTELKLDVKAGTNPKDWDLTSK